MSESTLKERFELLSPLLDERMRRLVVAVEAELFGYGGVSRVSEETGVSRRAITDGKKELKDKVKKPNQELAKETGLFVSVCHLPSGTSKWNKIEHWLFSFITQNWRGRP